jgi:dimethylargininase
VKAMDSRVSRYAIVRPVPDSYGRCVRTNSEKIDVGLAKKQHAEYCRALRKLGLDLVWAEGSDELPDSCFVEDAAVVLGDIGVICNMRVQSRADEVVEVARVLKKFMRTHPVVPPAMIDGGDVLKVEERVFVGISARTNVQAVGQLREILGDSDLSIVPVEVHRVLHLKSACTYLGEGVVVLSEGCFETGVLKDLRKIVVPKGEEYAADCLAVNGTVLMAEGYAKTRRLVEREGFSVTEINMSEFRKGDGALTCLSIVW